MDNMPSGTGSSDSLPPNLPSLFDLLVEIERLSNRPRRAPSTFIDTEICAKYDGECEEYVPGHKIHHVQALRAVNSPPDSGVWVPAIPVALDGPFITVSVNGQDLRLWTHDEGKLAMLWELSKLSSVTVTWAQNFHLLRFQDGRFGHIVNLARVDS